MRILVIGATGLLGRVLLERWADDEVIGAGSRDADVRDPAQVKGLFERCRPEWTVLAAAYADVDGCEKHPERAHQVNCVGAANVARAAREARSKLLFLSTDYVFDGTKNAPYEPGDPTRPLNVYGRSKAEAEKGVRETVPDCCIVRTSWLFGVQGKCFPNTILELAMTRDHLSVVADQTGCPTFNRDLAGAIIKLVRANAHGTVHVTNRGACSWYEFAREILRGAGKGRVAVSPARTEDVPRPAVRPKYSVLSEGGLEKFGVRMRPWQEALTDYCAEYASSRVDLSATQTGAAVATRSALNHGRSR
ncbi:MAG TPA: dTDP-4-dehydrorhamnose reductase [Candidatus Angelobacter sp.]|nr:dTDP-4-dehydrorhamnose reductase [Candidatus Angelobacter sp.]